MAKKRKRPMEAPSFHSPSPKEQRKWSAQSMARTMLDTAPGRKKQEDAITAAVMAAATKAEKSARRGK